MGSTQVEQGGEGMEQGGEGGAEEYGSIPGREWYWWQQHCQYPTYPPSLP